MKTFHLPDLGEGLPEATIREWFVKEGDQVKTDQPLVSVETAKALMDVPAPFDGTIEKLFGQVGDIIETASPLIGFKGKEAEATKEADNATVVGKITTSDTVIANPSASTTDSSVKATPAVRALARKLGVDLTNINPQGERITREQVQQHANQTNKTSAQVGYTPLSPVKRAMVISMQKSHQQVVPATIMDEVNISNWSANQKITLRLIQAITKACQQEPMLNNSLDESGSNYKHNESINLGIAVDTKEGLFVPVMKNVGKLSNDEILANIELFKQQADTKSFPADILKEATITLSNFGCFAGRFAMPIIVPPQAAIIAAGRITRTDKHRYLPLSVTFDHRFITGGEAARFLKVLLEELH